MRNFIENAESMDYVVPAGSTIKSGDVVPLTDISGIAYTDGKEGETIALAMTGVFEIPKATGVIAQGKKVYWNSTDGNAVGTATGNTYVGISWAPAESGDPTINVKIG